jgi:hypothetical protein
LGAQRRAAGAQAENHHSSAFLPNTLYRAGLDACVVRRSLPRYRPVVKRFTNDVLIASWFCVAEARALCLCMLRRTRRGETSMIMRINSRG